MKKTFIILTLMVLFTGCVSKSKYTDLEKTCKSLTEENAKLKKQIDELENGEKRLVNLAKNSFSAGKYILANKYIKQLKERHPESTEISYFNNIQPALDEKVKDELALIDKVRKDSIKLANINNLGIWEIGYYADDFGDPTKESYISTELYGTFSNSATTNSDLKVEILIDKENIRIQLYEYASNHPINGQGFIYLTIRDKNNNEQEIRAYNTNTGSTIVEEEYDKKLRDILLSGGMIRFKAVVDKFGSPSVYNFSIKNANWLENAISKMSLINNKKM